MYQAIIVIHILLGLSIIGLILMQQGKGADAGATFGGGASGSVFGAQGAASFLSRTTAILATLFFITSLGLAWINGNRGTATDLMSGAAVEKEAQETVLPNIDGANPSAQNPPSIPSAVSKPDVTKNPVDPVPVVPTETKPVDGADLKNVEEQDSGLKDEVPAKEALKAENKKK